MPDMRFVRGHMIETVAYVFPHMCPGVGCAIFQWFFRQHFDTNYQALQK